jgi:hypothetical protein
MVQMQVQIPVVSLSEAQRFSKAWSHKGVALVIDAPLCQFAADFANVVLRSFAQSQMQAAQAAAKPKVTIEEK